MCVCKFFPWWEKTDRFIENQNFKNIFIQFSLEKVSVKHNNVYIKILLFFILHKKENDNYIGKLQVYK